MGQTARILNSLNPYAGFINIDKRIADDIVRTCKIPEAMRTILIATLFLLAGMPRGNAQLNVELLHQLVQHSKDENSRQKTARSRQAVTTANEEVNRSKMDELKQKYRTLQSRFHTLGLAIDATQIGLQAVPIIREIVDHQAPSLDWPDRIRCSLPWPTKPRLTWPTGPTGSASTSTHWPSASGTSTR